MKTLKKWTTGLMEFDDVIGGGIVPGSLTLIGGHPGVGKSTLINTVLGKLSKEKEKKVLLISGEETKSQVALRLKRLNYLNDNFYVNYNRDLESIKKEVDVLRPALVVIDSIQTTHVKEILLERPEAWGRLRRVTLQLLDYAKLKDIPFIIIGHITKDGSLAGPKLLEHMVDTVLYFESEKNNNYRILKSQKNRFGSSNKIGLFRMDHDGLKHIKCSFSEFADSLNEKSYGNCFGLMGGLGAKCTL